MIAMHLEKEGGFRARHARALGYVIGRIKLQ